MKQRLLLFGLMVVLLSVYAVQGHAQSVACEETITVVDRVKGQLTTKYQIYWKDSKCFRFQGITEDQYAGAVIVRDDLKEVWLLQPFQKTYMVFDYEQARDFLPEYLRDYSGKYQYTIQEVGVGPDMQGYATYERIATMLTADKREVTFDMILAPEINYWPLKITIDDPQKGYKIIQNYDRINTAELPDSLFNIPAEYRKIELPKITLPSVMKELNSDQ